MDIITLINLFTLEILGITNWVKGNMVGSMLNNKAEQVYIVYHNSG